MSGRRLKIAAAGLALALVGGAASFGPLVRAKAAATAERYGATVSVGSVRPRWNGATLRDVVVKLEDVPDVSVSLDEVVVDGALGSSRSILARGGTVVASGAPEQLASEVAKLRERIASKPADPAAGGTKPGSAIRVEGLRARWQRVEGASESVEVTGLAFAPGEGSLEIGAESVAGTVGRVTLSGKGLELGLERTPAGLRARTVTAREASVDLSAPDEPATTADATADPVSPSVALASAAAPVAPSPPAASAAPASAAARAAPPPSAVSPSASSRGDAAPGGKRDALAKAVAALRARGELALALMDERLTPGTSVVVEQASARVRVRGDAVSIGPGRVEVRREDGSPRKLVVEIARAAGEGDGDRLTARLSLPLGDGAAAAPLRVEMHGGPVPISALGLRDGDFGILEPERGSLAADAILELDDVARVVRFDGEGHLKGLSIRHEALSDQALRGIDLGFRGKAEASLDGNAAHAEHAELELGALRVVASGDVHRTRGALGKPDDFKVDVRWEVPLVACQSLLEAAPAGLFPVVAGSTMAGSLALKGRAVFDTAQLDKTYDVAWDSAVGCRMVAPRPQAAVERFQKPFKKTIYTPEGARTEAEFGPGTESWTSRSHISHFMEIAVITSEDGRFERHGGFDHEAIRNSIRENIRSRRFVRGASTISMQLAKNLYLPRDKTLSRKLEEAILTLYLEQVLTKDQMMELYLNVVEFGPMIYGIGPAARHYFHTSPEALTVTQAYYLASILPSPNKQHFGAGGAVSSGWMSHLRKLMKYAHHRGRLTDPELDDGLSEVPVFGSPSPLHEARDDAGPGDDEGVRREPWSEGDGDG